jgi:hypothetical protein
VLPTLGVSFGLPFPTHHYPISPYAPHAPNAHFGAISPNGLNLGLLNVNPLFSLQVTKNEHGEKLVKPFVNLHVTPNEGIIGKIGNLLLAKKGALHKHYHHHAHAYPPPPFHFNDHHNHHHSYPPHFEEHGPFLSHPPFPISHGPPPHGPPHLPPHGPPHHIFSEPPPPPFYKDNHFSNDLIIDDIAGNPSLLGFRSNNISFDSDVAFDKLYSKKNSIFKSLNDVNDDLRYARGFSNYNHDAIKLNAVHSLPPQAPGLSHGSEKVSFPSSRRRRDTDQPVPASLEKKESVESEEDSSVDSEGRAIAGKRQAFYQPQYQQKQCGPRAVCCRRPLLQQQQQHQGQPGRYNKCGVRSAQGINGRIKNPSYVDGNSEFGEWPW